MSPLTVPVIAIVWPASALMMSSVVTFAASVMVALRHVDQ
jgi:hypothetical protein